MEFQEQLYLQRKKQGLSQEELANIIGVSRQAVQKWESGAARPDLDNLMALAQYFGVSLDELVGNEPASPDAVTSKATNGYYSMRPPYPGVAAYYIPCRWHYEYKSKRTLWGLPLVHIHFADRGLAHARGIVAIGNTAIGLFAIGGLSMGLVSLGALSLGLLSIGGAALGG
ncbi:MAG: helix-turn-helix domain-containing protein, partial [Oscillospiraceae bacterium]|nr:helix-turn-helix domain-containing protein [Oscillospiraceae bacterium]